MADAKDVALLYRSTPRDLKVYTMGTRFITLLQLISGGFLCHYALLVEATRALAMGGLFLFLSLQRFHIRKRQLISVQEIWLDSNL